MIDRRTTLKWVLTAATALPLLGGRTRIAEGSDYSSSISGYGTDPDLTRTYQPGELWPLTLTLTQRATATALSDLIIPADSESPSASAVGVVSFIDEWVSAPYPEQIIDRAVIIDGLAWIETEANRHFRSVFCDLREAQQRFICNKICCETNAIPSVKAAAKFFARFRNLVAGAFYTTPEGRRDLKYIGNTPLAVFDGPPLEVKKMVGVL